MREPTEAQAQLIKYFADGTKPTARTTRQTYAWCEAEGWIIPTEKFPYHKATDAGRTAVGLSRETQLAQAHAAALEEGTNRGNGG